ncbi:MAG: sulfatase-like hydrolase/transferase, partial [Longimicrobiales bacterium]
MRPGDLLILALVVALLTSIGELALIALQKYVLGYPQRMSASVVWMTPVAVAIIFAVPATLLLSLSRLWPRFAHMTVVCAVFVFLGSLSVLLVERRLSFWALVLLSLGIAVQTGRLATRYRPQVMRIVRLAAAVLVACVLLMAATVEIGLAAAEQRRETGQSAAREGSPNVLFIILDTVRAISLSLYGYDRPTSPNLERLAERGVVFERAIVPGTWTLPSHASMLTGRWPHELSGWFNSRESPAPFPTLAHVLGQHGYRTGGFVGNWYHLGRESGLSDGFNHYSDLHKSPAQIARCSALVRWLVERRQFRRMFGLYETLGRRRAPSVSSTFLQWVDEDSSRQFFAFLNYFDAHSPYLPPAPFNAKFGSDVADREPIVIEELNRVAGDAETIRKERDAYDSGIAYLDDRIGKLLDELEQRGLLENTIIIVGADHGEEIGEHGRFGHAYSLYSETIHVPLIIVVPGGPRGLRVPAPVSLRNIPATIADLAGLSSSLFAGGSLARYWRDENTASDTVLTVFDTHRSLFTDRYHYFTGVLDRREHLFDFLRDPRERYDLMGTPEAERVLPMIRATLAAVAPPRPSDRSLG